MTEHDDLIERLRSLGGQPIDPALQSAHLTAMAGVRPSQVWTKVRVAAAFLAGLLIGGSGLAAAGALPDPAQNLAHSALAQVGVNVPQPDRYHGPECGSEAKANHGGYVQADKALAKSDCGKPVHATGDRPGARGKSGDRGPCQGPPPWALDKSMTDEQRATAQAEREAACPDDAEEGSAETEERTADAAVPVEPTTTTTAPEVTTTEAPEPTTTSTTTTEAAEGAEVTTSG